MLIVKRRASYYVIATFDKYHIKGFKACLHRMRTKDSLQYTIKHMVVKGNMHTIITIRSADVLLLVESSKRNCV